MALGSRFLPSPTDPGPDGLRDFASPTNPGPAGPRDWWPCRARSGPDVVLANELPKKSIGYEDGTPQRSEQPAVIPDTVTDFSI